MGHALIENRHGLVVQADATQATGKAEREAALVMIDRHDPGSERRLTLAADKGYDTSDYQSLSTTHLGALTFPNLCAHISLKAISRWG